MYYCVFITDFSYKSEDILNLKIFWLRDKHLDTRYAQSYPINNYYNFIISSIIWEPIWDKVFMVSSPRVQKIENIAGNHSSK